MPKQSGTKAGIRVMHGVIALAVAAVLWLPPMITASQPGKKTISLPNSAMTKTGVSVPLSGIV